MGIKEKIALKTDHNALNPIEDDPALHMNVQCTLGKI